MIRFLIFIAFSVVINTAVATEYKGTSFWFTFLQSDPENKFMDLTVKISSESFTRGSIKMRLPKGSGAKKEQYWEHKFSLFPNTVETIVIPVADLGIKGKNPKIFPNAFYIETELDVLVTVCNNSGNSSDAAVVLPANSLGYEYIVANYPSSDKNFPNQYNVVATEDSTVFEINNTVIDKDQRAKNTWHRFTLNKGEFIAVQSLADLSGSRIRVLNRRRVAVFNGSGCAAVPDYCQSCDHLFEQAVPIASWKYEYAVVNFISREKDFLRITAKEDSTELTINGEKHIIAKAGKFYETELKEPAYIQSKKPISVAQYAVGTACDVKTGDPSMVVAKDPGSLTGTTLFPVQSEDNVMYHYLTVIVKTADRDKLKINGIKPETVFEEFSSNPGLSFIRVQSHRNENTVSCNCNYTFTAYGFGFFESYAY